MLYRRKKKNRICLKDKLLEAFENGYPFILAIKSRFLYIIILWLFFYHFNFSAVILSIIKCSKNFNNALQFFLSNSKFLI